MNDKENRIEQRIRSHREEIDINDPVDPSDPTLQGTSDYLIEGM